MFPYVVAALACLLFFYDPLLEYVYGPGSGTPGKRVIPRTPRPRVNESLLAIDDGSDGAGAELACPPDAYVVHVLSKAPLVLYVENFLSEGEREHLLEVSEPIFEPSTVTADGATTRRDSAVRDSEVALVPRTAGVRCVERRARALQGWRADLWVERLRVQRYRGPGGHYAHHFDWGSGARGWGRVSSIMAWVHASGDGDGDGDDTDSLEGGGTEFPLLRWKADRKRWCERWLECSPDLPDDDGDGDGDQGLEDYVGATFRPVPGNAVFWENFQPDGTGTGWEESWHAGLPVKKGVKVGLNIWSMGRLT